jgi:hypothetical protein
MRAWRFAKKKIHHKGTESAEFLESYLICRYALRF